MRTRLVVSVASVLLSAAACSGQVVDVGSMAAPDAAALSSSGDLDAGKTAIHSNRDAGPPSTSGRGAGPDATAGEPPTDASASTNGDAACLDTLTDSANCGVCGHSCQGAACNAGQCQPTILAMGSYAPHYLAVDDTNVYFTETDGDGTIGGVLKVAKSGGSVVTIASSEVSPGAITADGTNVYWITGNDVNEVAAAGGAVNVLSSFGGGLGIATDSTYVYWTDQDQIYKVPIGGGATVPVVPPDISPDDGGVAIDGGSSNDSGDPGAIYGAIALDTKNIYVLERETEFMMVPGVGNVESWGLMEISRSTGMFVADVTSFLGNVTGFAVNGDNLYYADTFEGLVETNSVEGNSPQLLAQNQNNPAAIATDGKSLYWINGSGSLYVDGGDPYSIMKMDLYTGEIHLLESGQNNASQIALDDTSVYWTTANAVLKVAK